MARVNRFDQPVNIRSTYMPREFIPNFDAYAQVMQTQQAQYDQLLDTANRVPQYQQADKELVEKYRTRLDESINNITDIYTGNGLQAGNLARRDHLRQLQRDWQPGGEAYVVQENYNALKTYKESLDQQLAEGNINPDKYNALLNVSQKRFQGSFVDGVENQFTGMQAAKDINLAEYANEVADGWMANRVKSGQYQVMGGQYYDMIEKRFVDFNEVYQGVLLAISSNPAAGAFLRQEAELFGRDIKEQLHNAATFAATKYGFTEYDSNYLKNWVWEQDRRFDHDKDLKEMDQLDYYTSGVIDNPMVQGKTVDPNNWNKQTMLGEDMSTRKTIGYSRLTKRPEQRPGTANMTLSEYAETPAGKADYPELDYFFRSYPIKKENGVPQETPEQYNERVADVYNQSMEKMKKTYITYGRYDPKKSKSMTTSIVGGGGAPGMLGDMSLRITDGKNNVVPITRDALVELTGWKTEADFQKHGRVLGSIQPDNPVVTGGQDIAFAKKGGGIIKVIATSESVPATLYKAPLREAYSVVFDPTKDESDVFSASQLIPGTNNVGNFFYKAYGHFEENPESGLQDRKGYAIETDNEGTPVQGRDPQTGDWIYHEGPITDDMKLNLELIRNRHLEVNPHNN